MEELFIPKRPLSSKLKILNFLEMMLNKELIFIRESLQNIT